MFLMQKRLPRRMCKHGNLNLPTLFPNCKIKQTLQSPNMVEKEMNEWHMKEKHIFYAYEVMKQRMFICLYHHHHHLSQFVQKIGMPWPDKRCNSIPLPPQEEKVWPSQLFTYLNLARSSSLFVKLPREADQQEWLVGIHMISLVQLSSVVHMHGALTKPKANIRM